MKRSKILALVVTTWLAVPAVAVSAPETHPFTVHDMLAMDRISDPQVSPDGGSVAFVLRATDLEANRGRTDLWLVPSAGGEAVRLTSHEGSDTSPRWSRDGKWVYFLSSRSGSSQVWRIAPDGGEAVPVTNYPLDVDTLLLSPVSDVMAVTMEVFPDCDTLACTKDRLEAAGKKGSGQTYDRLFVRHWDTWEDGRRSHLFTAGLDGGPPMDVTTGIDADVPSKPFGGSEEIAFTPDGSGLVFTMKDASASEAWSTNFDLYLTPVNGRGRPRNLTAGNPAWDTQPVFSPDGRTLAWLAMSRAGFEADRFRIVLMDWPDGRPRVLTQSWDRSPDSISWSADGTRILAAAPDVGQVPLFSVDPSGGGVAVVVKEGHVRSPAAAGKRVVFGMDHLRSPVELYSVALDGSGPAVRLTHFNDGKVQAARMGEAEQFAFKGWNNEEVHAWVVKPVDFEAGRKYPVAFLIHGGPQGSFNNEFHYRWNPQAYAGAGYAAVMVDFHGSVGYGQNFQDAIRNDWAGKPFVDLQKGLAAALQRYPWMDGDRVCGLGASYGAFMINWIQGNWPDRFRCLVSHDGNLDETMAYYATEELWFPEWEHGGTPWDNPRGYEKQNPIDFVKNWKTPMLVVHGALDYRIPYAQGLATFTALQRRGIPSRLLFFPDENHWVLKPRNSIQWHDTVIGWLDQWLKSQPL